MAAGGTSEGCVVRGGEHFGQAVFAEAVSALKHKRNSFVLVITRVAHGTTRSLDQSVEPQSQEESNTLTTKSILIKKTRTDPLSSRLMRNQTRFDFIL